MSNKYSKSNISSKAKENKSVQKHRESKTRLNTTSRILAIIMVVAVAVTFCLMTGLTLMN